MDEEIGNFMRYVTTLRKKQIIDLELKNAMSGV